MDNMIIHRLKIFTVFSLWFLWLQILHIEGCAPPLPPLPRQDVSAGGGNIIVQPPNVENPIIRNSRVFDGQTQVGVETPIHLEKATTFVSPVQDPLDLYCGDFNEKCRWRNMEGLFVDELDWFQGAGFLDEARLRIATGTYIKPEGFYCIAATDKIEFPNSKAVLISDVIECQLGIAELKFQYWTSPEVRIVVCTKTLLRLYPDYDYCAIPIENNDPGPASVTLPDLNGLPFQIYLRAENFVFHTENLQGGFAIIDNIEYFGDFCPRTEFGTSIQLPPTQLFAGPFSQQSAPPNLFSQNGNINNNNMLEQNLQTILNNLMHPPNATTSTPTPIFMPAQFPTLIPPTIIPAKEHQTTQQQYIGIPGSPQFVSQTQERPLQFGATISTPAQFNQQNFLENNEKQNYFKKTLFPQNFQELYNLNQQNLHESNVNEMDEACYALNCSFDDHCAEYVLKGSSDWQLAKKPVGTMLSGIRGDASILPYNKEGKFVYAVGQKVLSRFSTRSFKLPKNVYLMFSYYKVSRKANLRMIVKRVNSDNEEILFEAPKLVIESRRWFHEVRPLTADSYSYLAFEVEDLAPNVYVGIDEMVLLDEKTQEPICTKKHKFI